MSYITSVQDRSPSRIWINNPTMAELDLSIQNRAVRITANPTYAANQIKRDLTPMLPYQLSGKRFKSPTMMQWLLILCSNA